MIAFAARGVAGRWTWLGGTRLVAHRRFEQWLAGKTGSVLTA
jgi:hypothetical protein